MDKEQQNLPEEAEGYRQKTSKTWTFYALAAATTAAGLFFLLVMSVLSLRWINPSVTAFTLQENWQEVGIERYSLRVNWTPADEIPEHMKWAVIASEDQLFREHAGFDLDSIREAWEERQDGGRTRGASTISQQVAKNLYLWPGQSFFRKGLEAGITLLIELFWPKERILEVYLNIAEFGPGIFGIGKAADFFYGLSPSRINPDMAARMAAVLPSPKRMRVEPPSPFTQERSRWILRQMTQLSGLRYVPDTSSPQGIEDDRDPFTGNEKLAAEKDTLAMDTDSLPPAPDLETDLNIDTTGFNPGTLNLPDSLREDTIADTTGF